MGFYTLIYQQFLKQILFAVICIFIFLVFLAPAKTVFAMTYDDINHTCSGTGCLNLGLGICEAVGFYPNNFCNEENWTLTYGSGCRVCAVGDPDNPGCTWQVTYDYNVCDVNDRCEGATLGGTGYASNGHVMAGQCSVSSYDGSDPNSACITGGWYKQCCSYGGVTPTTYCSNGICPAGSITSAGDTTCSAPTPTPTPYNPGPYCGDGNCGSGEDGCNCAADCHSGCGNSLNISGSCPNGTPTINASWSVGHSICNAYVRGGGDHKVNNFDGTKGDCSGSWSGSTFPDGVGVVSGGVYQLLVGNDTGGTDQSGTTTVYCPPPPPTSTPVPQPAACDSNQVTMTADPSPVGLKGLITFNVSGSQGSTFIGDTWKLADGTKFSNQSGCNCTSGTSNCSTWGSKTCSADYLGTVTWTHYWKNCAPSDCSRTSGQCSKTMNFQVRNPTGSITANPLACSIPQANPTVVNKFAASFYNTDDLSGAAAVVTRTDNSINYNWGASSPSGINADNFSARWTGYIKAPGTGVYTFYTEVDDGVRLWINNSRIINHWADTPGTYSGTYYLRKNEYTPIKLEYYEHTGNAKIKLSWSGPSLSSQQIISGTYLYLDKPNQGLNATYYSNASTAYPGTNFTGTAVGGVSPQVNYNWGAGSPDTAKITGDKFSARWSGYIQPKFTENYTFSVLADDGFKFYVNDMDNPLITHWQTAANPPVEYSDTIDLKAGNIYPIKLEYFENGGDAQVKLYWQTTSSSDVTKQLIPTSALYPISPANATSDITWSTAYFTNPILCLDTGSGYRQWTTGVSGIKTSTLGNGASYTYGIFNNGVCSTPVKSVNVTASCPLLPSAANLSPYGTVLPGLKALTWSPVTGAANYDISINDKTTGSSLTCGLGNDVCASDLSSTTYNYTFQSGHTYQWCVDTYNICGLKSIPTSCVNVTVTTPNPSPSTSPSTSPDIMPWIQTSGDVHSNKDIVTPGGP